MTPIDVRLELGSQRVFAIAVDWPGWARSARSEDDAIGTLLAYAPRYKAATRKRFAAKDARVVERAEGDGNTDFGVPGSPAIDRTDVDPEELRRLVAILESCWATFDAAVAAAAGRTLTTGPRGGGRSLAKIRAHHLEGEHAYLRKLGGRPPASAGVDEVRAAFLVALEARRRGDLPDRGPRGGARWTPREAIRRSAWHALDHAWEIEDRS